MLSVSSHRFAAAAHAVVSITGPPAFIVISSRFIHGCFLARSGVFLCSAGGVSVIAGPLITTRGAFAQITCPAKCIADGVSVIADPLITTRGAFAQITCPAACIAGGVSVIADPFMTTPGASARITAPFIPIESPSASVTGPSAETHRRFSGVSACE